MIMVTEFAGGLLRVRTWTSGFYKNVESPQVYVHEV